MVKITALLLAGVAIAHADDHRIHPICDDTKTPRCWVEHGPPAPRSQLAPAPPSEQSPPPAVYAQPARPVQPSPPPVYAQPQLTPPPALYGPPSWAQRRPIYLRFGPISIEIR